MNASKTNPDCSCKSECVRHGNCKERHNYHNGEGALTHCQIVAQKAAEADRS